MQTNKILLKIFEKVNQISTRLEQDLINYNFDIVELIILSKFIIITAYEEINRKLLSKYYSKKTYIISSALKNTLKQIIIQKLLENSPSDVDIIHKDMEIEIYKKFDRRDNEYEKTYNYYSKISGGTTVRQIKYGIIGNDKFFISVTKHFLKNALPDNAIFPNNKVPYISKKIRTQYQKALVFIEKDIIKTNNFIKRIWLKLFKIINEFKLRIKLK